MAARLARAKATVVIPAEEPGAEPRELKSVSVVVRGNVATVRLGADVLVEREAVARVVPRARRSWTLMFDNPAGEWDVWTITDERRACCGGR